jgi:hypothetical protein
MDNMLILIVAVIAVLIIYSETHDPPPMGDDGGFE